MKISTSPLMANASNVLSFIEKENVKSNCVNELIQCKIVTYPILSGNDPTVHQSVT